MRQFLRRLWYLLNRTRLEAELAEELQLHRTLKQADLERSGLSPDEARRAAQRAFGRDLPVREDARAVWISPIFESAWTDARYAVRSVRRYPSFALAVIATLAIGLGANSAIFSLVDAIVLNRLPVSDAARLVRFVTRAPSGESQLAFAQDYKAWRDQTSLFESVSAHRLEFMNLTGGATPELAPVARVTASFFRVFPATAAYGRTFTADEDRPGGAAVAVLDRGFWARHFGSDPHVIGRSIEVNGVRRLIVGILPSQYETQQFDSRPAVWIPLQYDLERKDGGDYSTVTARLKPGVTLDAANASLAIAYAASHPASHASSVRTSWAAEPLQTAMAGGTRNSLLLLFTAVALLLLVACVNVANLLLARADARHREIAIRRALGAGKGRIVRQYVTECVVLAVMGGAAGLGIGIVAMRGVLALYPPINPFNVGDAASAVRAVAQAGGEIGLNWDLVAFTFAVSLATAVAFGALTAMTTGRQDPSHALRHSGTAGGSGTPGHRFRLALTVGEIALALMLVIGAALLIRTSVALRSVQPGFRADHVLTLRMSVTGAPFQTAAGMRGLTGAALDDLRSVAGVTAAGAACCMPLETVWQLPFIVEGRPAASLTRAGRLAFSGFGGWTFVSAGYFEAMGIPLLRGRGVTAADTADAPGVVVINEAMARRFWPQGDPLRDELRVGRGMAPQYDEDPVRRIVGIVGDVRDRALNQPARPVMYVPVAQLPDEILRRQLQLLPLVWFVRTAVPPYLLSAPVSAALQRASGGLPVARIRSLEDVVSESTARTRFDTVLMIVFGGVGLLLAAVGVYGLIAYMVERRTREVGIRIALGARAGTVQNMILRRGMTLAAAGIVLGLIGALAIGRLLAGFLFGVTAHDPAVFLGASFVLLVAAFVATLAPARRASRVDPIVALRTE